MNKKSFALTLLTFVSTAVFAKQIQVKLPYFEANFEGRLLSQVTNRDGTDSVYAVDKPAFAYSEGNAFLISGKMTVIDRNWPKQVRCSVQIKKGQTLKTQNHELTVSDDFNQQVIFSPESAHLSGLPVVPKKVRFPLGIEIPITSVDSLSYHGSSTYTLSRSIKLKLPNFEGEVDYISIDSTGKVWSAQKTDKPTKAIVNNTFYRNYSGVLFYLNGVVKQLILKTYHGRYYDWWNKVWRNAGYRSETKFFDEEGREISSY